MIGGEDVVLPTLDLDRVVATDVCVRAIIRRWPRAVIQSGTTAEIYPRYQSVPFGEEREIMIYRDRHALESWDELESHPTNHNTMVHLLAYGDGKMTIVVDDANAEEMRLLLEEIRRAMRNTPRVSTEAPDSERRAA